jgi:cell division protein FtsB
LPRATFREWLKIIIPVVTGLLAYQAFLKQSDQVRIQGEQLAAQGGQLKLQVQQLEEATRTANIAEAARLSSQLIAVPNARQVLA